MQDLKTQILEILNEDCRVPLERIATEMPDVMITPEDARAMFTQEDLVVIVDTFSKDIVEDVELYKMAKHVVVIDQIGRASCRERV